EAPAASDAGPSPAVATQPTGVSNVDVTLVAASVLRLVSVPVTWMASPGRTGLPASLVSASTVTLPGTVGGPYTAWLHDGAASSVTGTPPRTVPRLVSDTFSSPFPVPPLLVTAIASVLVPFGSRIPFGTTNVCCGPTLAMYWPMFQPLT